MATPEGFCGREMREENSFKDKVFIRTNFGIIYIFTRKTSKILVAQLICPVPQCRLQMIY